VYVALLVLSLEVPKREDGQSIDMYIFGILFAFFVNN
jgi:hypothetical protein